MAASTGPDQNTYQIPEVELADTFNVWRDTTNTALYKLNKIRVYDGVSSGTIDITVAPGGTFSADIQSTINKGLTFLQPVIFQSGVTFNGEVTFNADKFTVNANAVTIDDYNIVLGDTAGTSDATITTAGGGGILLKRGGSGATAEWLWKATAQHGLTGIWTSNAHIGFDGASAGIRANSGGVLPIYASGIALTPTTIGNHHTVSLRHRAGSGETANAIFEFVRTSPESAGITAFIEVLNGTTWGSHPFVSIPNGANKKIIPQVSGTGLQFGEVVRFNGTNYVRAIASDSASAEVVGIVSRTISTTSVEITLIGEIYGNFSTATENGGSLTPGATYYLSPFAAGKITATQPTGAGFVHKAVLIATGTNSAIVLPFTGGVLAAPLNVTNASSVAMRIEQINRFKRGDIVRFQSFTPGITLTYRANRTTNIGDILYQQYYPNGIYVLADARNETEGEVAGMVVDLYGATGSINNEAYSGFDVLMDGWFNTGISGTIAPGTVYWLRANYRGTTQAYENDAATSFHTQIANLQGQLQKPLFMATSSQSGYLYSYRGNVASGGVGVSFAALNEFLVRDIRGVCAGDLVVGVFDGTVGGKEAIRLAAGFRASPDPRSETRGSTTGYVGIGGGWNTWASGVNHKILYPLDVNGAIRAGAPALNGGELLVARHTDDAQSGITADTLAMIGTERGSGNLVLGRGVRPSTTTNNAYISSISGAQDRGVLSVGVEGTVPALKWSIADNSNVNRDSAVTLTNVFSVINDRVGIGTLSPQQALDVRGGIDVVGTVRSYGNGGSQDSMAGFLVDVPTTFTGGWARGLNWKNGSSTAMLGLLGTATTPSTLFMGHGATPWSGTNSLYLTTGGNVGIGESNPATKLDVNGLVRSNVAVTQITDNKHLATKEYVDSRNLIGTGIGAINFIAGTCSLVTNTNYNPGLWGIQITSQTVPNSFRTVESGFPNRLFYPPVGTTWQIMVTAMRWQIRSNNGSPATFIPFDGVSQIATISDSNPYILPNVGTSGQGEGRVSIIAIRIA